MIKGGIFSVYKPRGITSAEVTTRIKNILLKTAIKGNGQNALKVGHGGTLDRCAEGVLVIGVGDGCKKLRTFLDGDKCYETTGEFGKATDTYDSDGTVTCAKPYGHITLRDLHIMLRSFEGRIYQTPPIYSALKKDGMRLSDLARQGLTVAIQPRPVTIHSITLIHMSLPHFTLSVHCSSGTYIRSLVHDIGVKAESVAYVTRLCRTKQGQFELADALKEDDWTFQNILKAIETRTLSNERN